MLYEQAVLEEEGGGKVLVVDGGGSLSCALLGGEDPLVSFHFVLIPSHHPIRFAVTTRQHYTICQVQ